MSKQALKYLRRWSFTFQTFENNQISAVRKQCQELSGGMCWVMKIKEQRNHSIWRRNCNAIARGCEVLYYPKDCLLAAVNNTLNQKK